MSDARTEGFPRRDGQLHVEDVPVAEIIDRVGTPAYLYSGTALGGAYDAMASAFAGRKHLICYAIKANMNLAVVRTLVARGAGA